MSDTFLQCHHGQLQNFHRRIIRGRDDLRLIDSHRGGLPRSFASSLLNPAFLPAIYPQLRVVQTKTRRRPSRA